MILYSSVLVSTNHGGSHPSPTRGKASEGFGVISSVDGTIPLAEAARNPINTLAGFDLSTSRGQQAMTPRCVKILASRELACVPRLPLSITVLYYLVFSGGVQR